MAIHEYMLSHKELVKAIIVHRNIHEGFWCLNINFNIAASHGVESPNPSVALSIMSIGITQSPEANDLTVDAAVANPWRAQPVEVAEAVPVVPAAVEPVAAAPVTEAATQPVMQTAMQPAPAVSVVASNTELLAKLPSRFGRNIYGNVAVSFRPGATQQGPVLNGSAPAAAGKPADVLATVDTHGVSYPEDTAAAVDGAQHDHAPNGNSSGTNGHGANGHSANGHGPNGHDAHFIASAIIVPPEVTHGNA